MWLVGDQWAGNDAGVPTAFKNFAVRKHKERWEYMTFDIHLVAFALSPHYHDQNIFNMRKVMSAVREVLKFFSPNGAHYNCALGQLAQYKALVDELKFPEDEDGVIKIDMSPKTWWQLHGSEWPELQVIALRVFSIGTSSSASERNFR